MLKVDNKKTFFKIKEIRKTLLDIEEYVKDHYNLKEDIHLNNNDAVQDLLFNKLKYPILEKTEKGTPSTKKEVLKLLLDVKGGNEIFTELRDFDDMPVIQERFSEYKFPMAEILMRYRKYNKLYLALINFLELGVDFNADEAIHDDSVWETNNTTDIGTDTEEVNERIDAIDFDALEEECARNALIRIGKFSPEETEQKLEEYNGLYDCLKEFFNQPINRRRLSDIYSDNTYARQRYYEPKEEITEASIIRRGNNLPIQGVSMSELSEIPRSVLEDCIRNTAEKQDINVLNEYMSKFKNVVK